MTEYLQTQTDIFAAAISHAGMKPAEVDKDKLREFAYRYADSLNLLSEEQRVKSEEQESENWKLWCVSQDSTGKC